MNRPQVAYFLTGEWPTFRPARAPVAQQHDLIADELAMLESPEGERHMAYWAGHYRALDEAAVRRRELPFVNDPLGPPRTEALRVSLSDDEARRVREACGGRPDYAFWRTMYGIALGILVNRTRVAFWAHFLNRHRPGASNALAWCAHAHVLAVDAPWSLRWTDAWRQVRGSLRQAQMHEAYSLDSLAVGLGCQPRSAGSPLSFDVFVERSTYTDTPLQPINVPGGAFAVPGELSLLVYQRNHSYTLEVTFDSGSYRVDGVSRLLALLHETIRACASNPAAKVDEVFGTVRRRMRHGSMLVDAR